MGEVRRFAVAGLEEAARRSGRRRGPVVGALDETGQVEQGTATSTGRSGRRDAQPHGAPRDAVHGGLRRGDFVENDLRAAEQFGVGAGEGRPAGSAGKQRRA
jgi:hypothetical protein